MGEYYNKVGVCYDFRERDKIFLLYTYRCNAQCAHCLTESGPRVKEKMPLVDAKELVDVGAGAGKRFLTISGGEPTLYYDEVLELIAHASGRGYFVNLNTNAYWARTPAMARSKLAEMKAAGLCSVFPSSTAYHLPYVGVECVRAVIDAAAELDVVCEVNFYASPFEEEDRKIYLALDLDQRDWFYDGMNRTGRDISAFESVYPTYTPEQLDDCGSVHMAISPRGEVICNCNMSYKNVEFSGTPFLLGNLYETPFEQLLEKEKTDPILAILYDEPHGTVHAMLRDDPVVSESYLAAFGERHYLSTTEYYLELFKSPFMERLEQLAVERVDRLKASAQPS